MDTLLLTRGQIAKIEKARTLGRRRYKIIRMSSKQIEKNRSYQGGNLHHVDEKDNHLNTISSIDDLADGFYLIKRGHWMKVYPVEANGLYLKTSHPFSSYADFLGKKHWFFEILAEFAETRTESLLLIYTKISMADTGRN